jgi:hypothetical protein
MKKKSLIYVILAAILTLTPLLSSCSACDKIFSRSSELDEGATPDIAKIIKNYPETVSYEIVYTASDSKLKDTKASVYIEPEHMRINTDMLHTAVHFYIDTVNNVQYSYSKILKTAVRTKILKHEKYTPQEWIRDLDPAQATIIGSQKIKGTNCAVIKYEHDNFIWTLWLDEATGFPMKMTRQDVVIDFNNVSYKDVNDVIFNLPSEAKIIDASGFDLSGITDSSEIGNVFSQIDIGSFIDNLNLDELFGGKSSEDPSTTQNPGSSDTSDPSGANSEEAQAIKELLEGLLGKINLEEILDGASSSEAINDVGSNIGDQVGDIGDQIGDVGGNIGDVVGSVGDQIGDAIEKIDPNKVKDFIGSLFG